MQKQQQLEKQRSEDEQIARIQNKPQAQESEFEFDILKHVAVGWGKGGGAIGKLMLKEAISNMFVSRMRF